MLDQARRQGKGTWPPRKRGGWLARRPSTTTCLAGCRQVLTAAPVGRLNLRTGPWSRRKWTYGLTSLPRSLAGQPNSNASGAATGRSRIGSTMSAMQRSAKTAASSGPVRPPSAGRHPQCDPVTVALPRLEQHCRGHGATMPVSRNRTATHGRGRTNEMALPEVRPQMSTVF